MNRRMVRFQVSAQLISQALAMPDGSTIHNIVRHDFNSDVFIFYVEHPDLPELPEGGMPLEITPIIKADYDKRPSTWLTFDWNTPPNYAMQPTLRAADGER